MRCPSLSCPGTRPHWPDLVPCCKRQDHGGDPDALAPLAIRGGQSLIVSSLEIGKVLARKNRVTFRPSGTCMYPCIRPGDILHIVPKSVAQLAVGDIAVYRRANRLFGHRIIDRRSDNGRPYIITRPDRAKVGEDTPSYDEDVLGVVSQIERRGKKVGSQKPRYALAEQLYFASLLKFWECQYALRRKIITALAFLQKTDIYQRIVRRWFAAKNAALTYSLRVPICAGQMHDPYRELSLAEFEDMFLTLGKSRPDRLTLALVVNGNPQPAASVTFVSRPPECPFAGWWVNEIQVRVRYRGAGLEEKLLQKAGEIFSRSGVTELWVNSRRELIAAMGALFTDLGFREVCKCSPRDVNGKNAARQMQAALLKITFGGKLNG